MKKNVTLETPPVDSLSLSFLDVLSCGLAAMLVLFFVFSVLPQGKEDMTEGSQGNGNDKKLSQSGVRAKGNHATPNRSPFGVIVVMHGLENTLDSNDIDWECPPAVKWNGSIVEQKINAADGSTQDLVRICGFTENSPRHFKKVSLWITTNKLPSNAEVEIVGTVENTLSNTMGDTGVGTANTGSRIKLHFGSDVHSPVRKGDKTLVLTVDRMNKSGWLQSSYRQQITETSPAVNSQANLE